MSANCYYSGFPGFPIPDAFHPWNELTTYRRVVGEITRTPGHKFKTETAVLLGWFLHNYFANVARVGN